VNYEIRAFIGLLVSCKLGEVYTVKRWLSYHWCLAAAVSEQFQYTLVDRSKSASAGSQSRRQMPLLRTRDTSSFSANRTAHVAETVRR